MVRLVVAGATGLVGKELVRQALDDQQVDQVHVITRRPLGIDHPKLTDITKAGQFPEIVWPEPGFQLCICLGTTIKEAGSQQAFRYVDYELPMRFATEAIAKGCTAIHLISSLGADARSSIFYSRVKGEVERDIAALKPECLYIYRPSLLLGNRPKPRLGEVISAKFSFLAIGPLAKYKPIKAELVAANMLQQAKLHKCQAGQEVSMIESAQMQKLAR